MKERQSLVTSLKYPYSSGDYLRRPVRKMKNKLQKYRVTTAQSIIGVAIARHKTDYVTFEIGKRQN